MAVEYLDLEQAIELYEQIAAAGSPMERIGAQLSLAWLDWRVYDDAEAARERLTAVIEENPDQPDSLMMLARLEIGWHNYAAAREAARAALELADREDLARDAQMLLAWATVEDAALARLSPGTTDGPSTAELEETLLAMRQIVEAEPGELLSSRCLLQTALLLDDGETALLAWRSYYWIMPDQEPAFHLLVEPYTALQEILPRWEGSESSVEDRKELIQALAGSRFYQEASLVALDPRVEGALSTEASDLVTYVRFIHTLQERLDESYRGLAGGSGGYSAHRVFEQEVEALCEELSDCTNRGAAYNIMRDRFGAEWLFRDNSRSLYMGHRIVDQEMTIEQYGVESIFHYVRLDNLVSHGVRSWLFDRMYQVGGTANEQGFVEFRPFRVNLLLNLAQPVLDAAAREAYIESIAINSEQDDQRAAENPYAYLPGLNQRLILRSLDAIWADAGADGLEGSEQRLRFLGELDAVWSEGPEVAHEGRHVIDLRAGINTQPDLEVRAKLAEIAFCRYPGIPLGNNVLHPNVGAGGHGQANLIIVQGLVDWMEEHTSEIEDLDPSRPLLPQHDLLTDDQLRAAARSLDPMANSQAY
jgi:tetratricopeptide (TPR) repeat protein